MIPEKRVTIKCKCGIALRVPRNLKNKVKRCSRCQKEFKKENDARNKKKLKQKKAVNKILTENLALGADYVENITGQIMNIFYKD